MKHLPGHELLIKSVERFPDRDEFECGGWCYQVFRAPDHPFDMFHSSLCCLFLCRLDHLTLKIDLPKPL
jgi:hypothetical protein